MKREGMREKNEMIWRREETKRGEKTEDLTKKREETKRDETQRN